MGAALQTALAALTLCRGTHALQLHAVQAHSKVVRGGLHRLAAAIPELPALWAQKDGEHAWLEEVDGDRALEWVRAQNERAVERLGEPSKTALYERVYGILTSKDKIPYLRKIGDHFYNFWSDAENTRGVWRRTDLESYRAGHPAWETVLSIDYLCEAEGESWVYKGHVLFDDGSEEWVPSRTLMQLSRGGADAMVVREFDLVTKEFIRESEGGFVVPEGKSRVSWLSQDELLVGTELSEGEMTSSGYPRLVRQWKRGTSIREAPVVYEGRAEDVSVSGYISRHQGIRIEWRTRSTSFYTSTYCFRLISAPVGHELADATNAHKLSEWVELEGVVPDDADLGQFGSQILISLRSAWHGHPAGSLLAVPLQALDSSSSKKLAGLAKSVFTPTEWCALQTYTRTRDKLLLTILDTVKTRTICLSYTEEGGWIDDDAQTAPVEQEIGGLALSAVDPDRSNEVWVTSWSFVQPNALSIGDVSKNITSLIDDAQLLRSLPYSFNAAGLQVSQEFATSADGTSVPYFLIKQAQSDGPVPTLLYGYGGFEVSLTPTYQSVIGAGWLEAGGAYAVANIRGGGEFGPRWHQAALKRNRARAYEDFEAVAEHLIATHVTTAKQLAIRGGSNGGLLVANMLVRRPELWGAVVCAVPLLDMKRYNKLLAGASWMAEYGDPDTPDWEEFLHRYSAYHNVEPSAKSTNYPPVLMTTSTRDDRVHPYHARAFVKRLLDCGHTQTTYYENMEGGHGGAADPKQQAFMTTLWLEFLWKTVGEDWDRT